jgi:2-dehydro-3-deoxyphosphogluconate aldolase/(4S)-4-hydroxy-2-oxoglutarate aldolase
VATSSEITNCVDLGLDVLKFFPVEPMGGVNLLNALAGPFRTIKFIPTGGISEENLADYARLPFVISMMG